MSYGSSSLQVEANVSASKKLSRTSFRKDLQDRPSKLANFEKEFNVNLSRVDDVLSDRYYVRDSMVAYSNKMRTLQDARYLSSNGKHDPLFVRAKHIPKKPVQAPKKRRPMSFDELLGRDRETAKIRPHSENIKPVVDGESTTENEMHLAVLSARLSKSNPTVGLVCASDFYEIVDFGVRSKCGRNYGLHMLHMAREAHQPRDEQYKKQHGDAYERIITESAHGKFQRSPDILKKLSCSEQQLLGDLERIHNRTDMNFYQEMLSLDRISDNLSKGIRLPTIDTFKWRPNRARRMKLVDPGLGDIPEEKLIEFNNSAFVQQQMSPVRVISPTPIKQFSKSHDFIPKTLSDVTQEKVEQLIVKDSCELNKLVTNNKSSIHTGSLQDSLLFNDIGLNTKPKHLYKGHFPKNDEATITHKDLQDDDDVKIEVTQCPQKQDIVNNKLKAQKRFKKRIYHRDAPR